MDGNLSDALNDGLWFWPLHTLLFYRRLDLQAFALVSNTGLPNAFAWVIKDFQSLYSWEFHSFNTSHWLFQFLLTTLIYLRKHISASLLISWWTSFLVAKPNLVVYFTMARTVHLVHDCCQMFVPNTMTGIISNKRKEQSESAEHFIATANEHLEGFDL